MTRVTAVILSYNRQDALRRQLLYYANKPVHLIFADGSDEDWGSGESGSIGEMTWEYFRIPGYGTYISRLQTAVLKVETEYMFFLDDEECVLPFGVERAIRFLEENIDHSCAGGRVGRVSGSGIRKRPLSKSFSVADWDDFSSRFELLQDDFWLRIQNLVSENRTANIYYQVHRTALVKKFSESLHEKILEGKYLGFFEILFCCFVVAHGKWQMHNYPYWFRNGGSVATPLELPKRLTDDAASELATALSRLLDDGFQAIDSLRHEDYIGNLIDVLLSVHGGHSAKTKSIMQTRPLYSRLLPRKALFKLVSLKHPLKVRLFEIYPTMYERLFPGEATRVRSYAKLYAKGDQVCESELLRFELIWDRYRNGLSKSDLELELKQL